MYKKLRKTAALILAAALCIQGAPSAIAEEAASQETQAPETKAPETKAPETEAPETKAPETQAPETQTPETQAPETQAPETQAPETKAPETQAPETQAPETKAPETQAPETQTPETQAETKPEEKLTEAATEKATEKETESKETERSERKNDGKKYSASDIREKMEKVSEYLIVANTLEMPDTLKEDAEILVEDAESLLDKMSEFSVSLANAKDSKKVEVINLYADENGKLDTAQLDQVSKEHVLDASETYYVINVIADSREQDLDFSGYKVKKDGETVPYNDPDEKGYVLYNFAALDGEEYVSYKGTVTLKNDDLLKGTFLAPKAEIKVENNLAGAVYADKVAVADKVDHLLKVVFAQKKEESSSEEGTMSDDAIRVDDSANNETTAVAETDAENATEPITEVTTEVSTEVSTETVVEVTTEFETETEKSEILNAEEKVVGIKFVDNTNAEIAIDDVAFTVTDNTNVGVPILDQVQASSVTEHIFYFNLLVGSSYTIAQTSSDVMHKTAENTTFTVTADMELPVVIKNVPYETTDITVNVSAAYKTVPMSSVSENFASGTYVRLFNESGNAVSEATEVIYAVTDPAGIVPTNAAAGIAMITGVPKPEDGSKYTIKATDAAGNLLPDINPPYTQDEVVIDAATVTEAAVVQDYSAGIYPEDKFSYPVEVTVTKNLVDGDEAAKADAFKASLYSDAAKTTPPTEFTFAMAGGTTATQTLSVLAKKAPAVFYLEENLTEAQRKAYGTAIVYNNETETIVDSAGMNVAYAEGKAKASAVITNTWHPIQVPIRAVDNANNYIEGVTLLIKDANGNKVEVEYNGKKSDTCKSGATDIIVKGLTEGATYYLSEVHAPEGYAPAKDVKFVATREQPEVLVHKKAFTTEYSITAVKQVYVGDQLMYAHDTNDTYAANRTFYAALFEDKDCKIKVSNVHKIMVNAFAGTTEFKNVSANTDYYLAETDANGIVKKSTGSCNIKYSNQKVTTSKKNTTATIQNIFSSRAKGYYYTAVLNIKMNLKNSAGEAEKTTGTFHAGLYKSADHSDTLASSQLITFDFKNASSVTVKKRFLFTNKSVTYHVAELDSSKKLITANSKFDYDVTYEGADVVLNRGDEKTVVINNKEKSTLSKVTLYITKKVFAGSSPKKVTQAFYAGLFKDEKFTELYTKPVKLNLEDKSEISLKLSLNIQNSEGATIYVAETDEEGNVIKDEKAFGYNIKLVNSKAAFTPERTEIQTTILNSEFGTSNNNDWNNVLKHDSHGNSGAISGNGHASDTTEAVQTGDETPIVTYVLLLAAALIIFIGIFIIYKKKRRD